MSTNPLSVFLECIDGKDDRLKIEIENGSSIVLGKDDAESTMNILELADCNGEITFSNKDGILYFDAGGCSASIKLNGNSAVAGNLKPNDLLRIGNSIWRSVIEVPDTPGSFSPVAKKTIKSHFSSIMGLEELKDFKLKNIFSNVFKKHSFADMEEQMVTGTSKNIPAITEIETEWARPWLFSRLLLVALIVSFLLLIGWQSFGNLKLLADLMFVGSFAVPLATLVFFLEMNAPRNISIFVVVALVFLGGVASLLVALVFFRNLEFISTAFGAAGAALIEEPSKLLIVIFLFKGSIKNRWILNGLLLGAAVGTGFEAFESAGYAFEQTVQAGTAAGVDNIISRALLAPFMHVVWTANAAAALWMVKGQNKFEWKMLGSPKFLRVLASSITLHFLWNSNINLIPLPWVFDIKFLILGFISWCIVFMLIQQGLKQLNEARKLEVDRLALS